MGLLEWLSGREDELKPGTHRFDGKGELKGHRFHLRVDNEEKGVLLVDASKLIHLNGTALDYVRCMLEDRTREETYRFMRRRYRGLRDDKAYADFDRLKAQLKAFIEGDDTVIENIGADQLTIGADGLPSPYRMDLALTYRCQNRCGHCYNEDKDKKEMSFENWLKVIDRLWRVGIPHIVFTGGEPTLYPHLREMIIRSERNGQITGINTNGRSFRRPGYLRDLVEVGLDHAQITVLSHEEGIHDRLVGSEGAWQETIEGLKVALAEDLYVNTNTTIMRSNIDGIEDTMRFLVDLGVKNLAFNGIIRSGKGKEAEAVTLEELAPVMRRLSALAEDLGVRLIWYSPTPYCEFNPVNMGLGIKQCTACSINMAIEPDGTVLPCQSFYEPLGNILTTSWRRIWDHGLCKEFRNRAYAPDKCKDCNLLELCGAGCPLSITHGDYLCMDRSSNM